MRSLLHRLSSPSGTGVVDVVPVHLDHAGPSQYRVSFRQPIAPALP